MEFLISFSILILLITFSTWINHKLKDKKLIYKLFNLSLFFVCIFCLFSISSEEPLPLLQSMFIGIFLLSDLSPLRNNKFYKLLLILTIFTLLGFNVGSFLVPIVLFLLALLLFFVDSKSQVIIIVAFLILMGAFIHYNTDLNYTIEPVVISSVKITKPSTLNFLENEYLYITATTENKDIFKYKARKRGIKNTIAPVCVGYSSLLNEQCKKIELMEKGDAEYSKNGIVISFPEKEVKMAILKFKDYSCLYHKLLESNFNEEELQKEINSEITDLFFNNKCHIIENYI